MGCESMGRGSMDASKRNGVNDGAQQVQGKEVRPPLGTRTAEAVGDVCSGRGGGTVTGTVVATHERCDVATLSSILRTEQVAVVDLLKVDAEGMEGEVLLGVDRADWPRIRQVVVEVHDVDGRLAAITALLAGVGGFDTVTVKRQTTSVGEDGYLSFIPRALCMFIVYAVRAHVEEGTYG